MDYRVFEQRLLDTIFTTDVQLSPATIAFLYKLQVQEASDLLQQAAVASDSVLPKPTSSANSRRTVPCRRWAQHPRARLGAPPDRVLRCEPLRSSQPVFRRAAALR